MSAAEFALLPDAKGCELVFGQLREKGMGAFSSEIAGWLMFLFYSRFDWRAHGRFFDSECGYQCWPDVDPDRVRKPDLSYVSKRRLPHVPAGWITIAPDLAVEVLSKNDRSDEVDEKVAEYLDAGVKAIWVVDPSLKVVRVFRSNHSSQVLTADQELRDDEILPGFHCQVAELFPSA
jgi:Uma2 family endonuclease